MRRLALLFAALPAAAHAHHFMGNALPRTWMDGFLSGLGHPVIGADHFAFVAAAGFLLAFVPRGFWGAVALVAGALAGAAAHLAGATLPAAEGVVAASVIVVGALVALGRAPGLAPLAGLLAVAGAAHGYAYAESIFGAEPAPLGAYLAGFSAIQLAIAAAAFFLHRRLRAPLQRPAAVALGSAAGAVGLLALLA